MTTTTTAVAAATDLDTTAGEGTDGGDRIVEIVTTATATGTVTETWTVRLPADLAARALADPDAAEQIIDDDLGRVLSVTDETDDEHDRSVVSVTDHGPARDTTPDDTDTDGEPDHDTAVAVRLVADAARAHRPTGTATPEDTDAPGVSRTTYVFTVLHPTGQVPASLDNALAEADDGYGAGLVLVSHTVPVPDADVPAALEEIGNDGGFFSDLGIAAD